MGTTITALLTLVKLGTQRPKQLQLHLSWQSQKHLIACNREAGCLEMIAFFNVSLKLSGERRDWP